MTKKNKEPKMKTNDGSMIFNVLVKKEENLFIAHCLELDIVATSTTVDQVTTDIIDLIKAQVDYAFSNDNLDHLYRPAPSEVWEELYACKNRMDKKIDIKTAFKASIRRFVPPSIIARTCMSSGLQACNG
jgi:hypothetical protein